MNENSSFASRQRKFCPGHIMQRELVKKEVWTRDVDTEEPDMFRYSQNERQRDDSCHSIKEEAEKSWAARGRLLASHPWEEARKTY